MAASSNMKRNYQVFLSFRGTDVRHNFLSHLYAAMDQKGIHTFVDREELRKGEQISPTLMKAIEESRVAIIIFSKDYASSPWCLEEVVKIMECKEKKDLIVFPVFYKVEPREVRRGGNSYGISMAKHESKFGKHSEKVERWKKALLDAGSLSGWDSNDRDEAELTQCIVKELSILLDRTPLHVTEYPVRIDSRVEELKRLSQEESADNDVLMIGLWGPGGIGKTTIAKALYDATEKQFQGRSFLARVRETSNQRDGLVALQKQLLSEILSHKNLTVYSVDGGISLIRERLCCKKVLLVLDDVDHLDQLNALAGKGDWFGKGSIIIVTSRDKHLLISRGIIVHEVQPLGHDEALDLFARHAFPDSKKVEIRRGLIDGALHYAGGLPLALEVLGSFLRGRKEPAWESTLLKLSKIPEPTINRILKISFDGLEDNEREIFLDIACFFKGKAIDYIRQVLDSCDFHTTIGIEILIERSLIKNEDGNLQMHDLIQWMGKDIVNQENPYDPGKRSRLWLFEDVQDILYEDTGANAVKAIVLNLPAPEVISINPDAFTNMKMLRILILHGVHISSRGPARLRNELRWLEWSNAPDLEFGPRPKKLRRLNVQPSPIRQLWDNFQNFRMLKSINFSECKSLASVPDLSSAPNLESLRLDRCQNLVEVHQSVGYLDKLRFLSLHECSNLSIFPNILKTKSLQTLDITYCFKLEEFSDIPEKMEHLSRLDLQGTAIRELPASIENLVSVERMILRHCKNLTMLPSTIYKLKNLKSLDLEGCSNFFMFPKSLQDSTDVDGDLGFSNLSSLVLEGCNLSEVEFLESSSSFPILSYLNLSNNKFTHLPTSIDKYDHLQHLLVDDCEQLQEIPQLPSNISKLDATNCKSLRNLPDLSSFKTPVATIEHVIGIDDRVKDVIKLLDIEDNEVGVRIVGIHGTNGIGKTTIAKAVYNRLSSCFDSCSFLSEIGETAQNVGGIQFVQNKLIRDILERDGDVASFEGGIKFFLDVFRNTKVLIVLDDVEDQSHLNELVGDQLDWFGPGSRIIVTLENGVILRRYVSQGLALIYEVNEMDNDRALELFCKHALATHSSIPDYLETGKRIIKAMGQVPFAIEVIGSFLRGKTIEDWWKIEDLIKPREEKSQERLKDCREILKICYEALDEKQKQIFWDIAWFANAVDSRIASYMWSDQDFLSSHHVLMPLAKIGGDNMLYMHKLLKHLSETIDQEEPNYRVKRRRLSTHDAGIVIKRKEGAEVVEALWFDTKNGGPPTLTETNFKSMPDIRFLKLDRASMTGNFTNVFPKLRWLRWQGCPRDFEATELNLTKLVILDLSWSKVTEDWGGWRKIKMEQLKVLNLTGCTDLLISPKFSSFPNLEILILERCSQLVHLDPSVGDLEKLLCLNLKFCTELNRLPAELDKLKALKELLIDETSVRDIPLGGDLKKLETLFASNCLSLSLPDRVGELVKLRCLSFRNCQRIQKLPESIGQLGSLEELDISGTCISELPDSFGNLQRLRVLKMEYCFVTKFPSFIWGLRSLEEIHASLCRNLEGEIPGDIGNLINLRILRLQDTAISSLPPEIKHLSKLETRDPLHCDMLPK